MILQVACRDQVFETRPKESFARPEAAKAQRHSMVGLDRPFAELCGCRDESFRGFGGSTAFPGPPEKDLKSRSP